MPYYAHTLQDADGRRLPQSEWELLPDHLNEVSRLAEKFARAFGAEDWGRLAGLWHDLGKYSTAFQEYLRGPIGLDAHLESSLNQPDRVDHSTAGAKHAFNQIPGLGKLLAYVIAGHHAGLADAAIKQSSLATRLEKTVEPINAAPPELLRAATELSTPQLSIHSEDQDRAAFQLALFTRMVFSSLVDADFLATEAFMDPSKSAERPTDAIDLPSMREALDQYLAQKAADAKATAANERQSAVNAQRQEVLAACRAAAPQAPGLFTLTVPTGGGKTLASLAFALSHAIQHGQRRVVFAIPFTSIIEQTAGVYREVFDPLGPGVVLEHHSNVDPDAAHETRQSRLASENWDAPLVVTTNVQFFESLFAARTSRCRKLHNLVGSVVILDEAQTLPVELLLPCLAALRELVADYRCTIVLCTATQPALGERKGFEIGLTGAREIIPRPEDLYEQMKRVNVGRLGSLTDVELCRRMAAESSFLAIVNTRRHAASLYAALRGRSDAAGLFHLSTNLCAVHRTEKLKQIRDRLAAGQSCRVISTQLIEAGVDVDFPVVFRALAGIDSIAQAAGRCNREGRLARGAVWVFDPADVQLTGYLRATAATAAVLAPDFKDLLDPAAVTRYFELHYGKEARAHKWDKPQVMACFPKPPGRMNFNFRTASERFRMIDDAAQPVFVPYGEQGRQLVEQLRYAAAAPPSQGGLRGLLRKLQRYTVGVFEDAYRRMLGVDIEELPGGYAVLTNSDMYDENLGLCIDRAGYHEPEGLFG
jgi:CRISPR-associated endonuclease/helicase Cas3